MPDQAILFQATARGSRPPGGADGGVSGDAPRKGQPRRRQLLGQLGADHRVVALGHLVQYHTQHVCRRQEAVGGGEGRWLGGEVAKLRYEQAR